MKLSVEISSKELEALFGGMTKENEAAKTELAQAIKNRLGVSGILIDRGDFANNGRPVLKTERCPAMEVHVVVTES